MLTHSDLRRAARVRAFMEFAGAELAKHRRAIEGEATGQTEYGSVRPPRNRPPHQPENRPSIFLRKARRRSGVE